MLLPCYSCSRAMGNYCSFTALLQQHTDNEFCRAQGTNCRLCSSERCRCLLCAVVVCITVRAAIYTQTMLFSMLCKQRCWRTKRQEASHLSNQSIRAWHVYSKLLSLIQSSAGMGFSIPRDWGILFPTILSYHATLRSPSAGRVLMSTHGWPTITCSCFDDKNLGGNFAGM